MSYSDPPDDPIDVRQACRIHRDAMYRACLRILRDRGRAEDATQDAIVTAIARTHDVIVKDWASWLCAIAQNTARQYLRRDATTRTVPLPDDVPDDDERDERTGEVQHLLQRATRLMSADELADFELYQEVRLTSLTQEELAEKLGMPLPEVQRRRKKALRTIRDAVVAVYLAENPGTGENRCTEPRELARAEADSPALREKIVGHARTCTKVCKPKRKVPKTLLRRLLAVPGLGLAGGLTAWLVEVLTPKKLAVVTTVAFAAVTVAVLVEGEQPAPPELVVVVPSSRPDARPPSVAPPVLPPPSSAPASSPAPQVPPEQQPEPPVQEEAPAPPPPVAPEPEPDDGARVEEPPPVIADGWVEEQRLVSDEDGRCDGPRATDVGAIVHAPGGLRSVTLHLRHDGGDIAIRMVATDGSNWVSRIGPFDGEGTRGRYDVVVEAVGTDGSVAVKKIAEVCVSPCRSGS